MGSGALVKCPRSDTAYKFRKDAIDVWLYLKDFAVNVHKTDEGLVCDIWEKGNEKRGVITSTYAFDAEVEKETKKCSKKKLSSKLLSSTKTS